MSELVYFGDAVKALDDQGKVGGYLVLFSTASDPDISSARDFFTKDTDFDFEKGEKRSIYYSHGMDAHLGKRRLGRGELEMKDAGVWVTTQLALRDDYEKKIFEMAKTGKLGWSSGSAPHLVERKAVGTSNQVMSWPIVEASLTPCPAEPRTSVLSIKSFEAIINGDAEHPDAKTFTEELQAVLDTCRSGVTRAHDIRELCAKEGRALSASRRERIGSVHSSLANLVEELGSLLDETQPRASEGEIAQLLAEIESARMGQTVIGV